MILATAGAFAPRALRPRAAPLVRPRARPLDGGEHSADAVLDRAFLLNPRPRPPPRPIMRAYKPSARWL